MTGPIRYDLVMYGYRIGHYNIKLNLPDSSLKVKVRKPVVNRSKPVAYMRELGWRQIGMDRPLLVPFIPDKDDVVGQVAACVHRFGCEMPEPEKRRVDHFVKYCKTIITSMKPIDEVEVKSFDDWLAGCGYSGGRREALRKLRYEMREFREKDMVATAFVKYESYPKPKCHRAILSYSDQTKVLLGPLINKLDKETFSQLKHFVKGTNPKNWPGLLRDTFGNGPVCCTDFTSFEAHHRGVYSYLVYFWMSHMFRNLKQRKPLQRLVKALVLGRNEIRFPAVDCEIDQRLMSGALWTSSSNGLLNFLLTSYMVAVSKYGEREPDELVELNVNFKGFFEGDDGVFEGVEIPDSLIRDLGIKLKMEKHSSFSSAGFCSVFCDENGGDTIKDPVKTLQTFFSLPPEFGVCRRNKVLSYFRAKALSFKYLFSNAPVVGPLMDWVLLRTRSIDPREGAKSLDGWSSKIFDLANKEPCVWRVASHPTPQARVRVEDQFNFPVSMQLMVEGVLAKSESDVVELDLSFLQNEEMVHHAQTFVVPRGKGFEVPELRFKFPDHVAKIMETGVLQGKGENKVKNQKKNFFLDRLVLSGLPYI